MQTLTTHPRRRARARAALTTFLFACSVMAHDDVVRSLPFHGAKANKGTVTYTKVGCERILTLSDDFVIPDTPAPHWQVVDSAGRSYLLQRLKVKGDRINQAVVVPAFVADVAKVQIWCAWAETLLGEAAFDGVVGGEAGERHLSSKFHGVKADKGHVVHLRQGAMSVLELSADFVIPDTPAPHWQVVDSEGNTYLLQRLQIKDGRSNLRIVVPEYVPDVAKVQIWCAWAETVLGEAEFEHPVM